MTTNKEIFESLKQLNAALAATIADAEKNGNILFYKESIKQSALHIFEKAQLLNNATGEIKAPVEIKIIKQREPLVEKEIFMQQEPIISKPVIQEPITPPVIESKPAPEIKKVEVEKPKPAAPLIKVSVKNDEEEEEDDDSVNAKIAKFQQPVINVADKLKDTPIKELVKAISISKKFEFINELFAGKAEAYKAALQTIESSGSFQQAADYIEQQVAHANNWEENEKLAAEFFLLVKRRFL